MTSPLSRLPPTTDERPTVSQDDLQARGAALSSAVTRAEAAMRAGGISAADPRGIVTIDLDDALDVSRIRLRRDWAEVGLAGLQSAFAAAHQGLWQVVLERWSDSMSDSLAGLGPSSGATPAGQRPATTRAEGEDPIALLAGATRRAEELKAEPDEGRPRGGQAVRRGSAAHGRVVVLLAGDAFQGLEIDEAWALRQSPVQLGEMLREALDAALDQPVRQPPNPYQQLMADFDRVSAAARARRLRRAR